MRRHKRVPKLTKADPFLREAAAFFGVIQRSKRDLICSSEQYRILSDLDQHVANTIRQISGEEVPWMRTLVSSPRVKGIYDGS